MKQDTKGKELLRQIVDETPLDLKTQLRYSDAIAIRLDGMLKKEECRNETSHETQVKLKLRCHDG